MKKNKLAMIIFLFCISVLLAPAGQAQAVDVTVNVAGDEEPGGVVTLTAEVDEGTIQSISWSQIGGAPALIGSPTANPTDVTLGDTADYNEELIHFLSEPEGGGGLQDRFQVVGINPFALEEAGMVTIRVSVTTTAGAAEAEVEINAALPWKPTTGIRNVATGIPVLLHRKDEATCNWSLTGPSGTLSDTSSQSPYFTPTVAGTYRATCGDDTLEIYVGNWAGGITGQDEDGRPTITCSQCHPEPSNEWAQTGHAEIFKDSLNTNNHYSEGCFSCHTVGYDPDVANGGIDEALDYEGFIENILHNPQDPENWNNTLANYPDVAQLGNIQCENCHGPQGGTHFNGEARISISSDVCGSCHGEPLRHARFQQWQLSGHGNFELAVEEGEEGGCAKCHTGNGFIAWQSLGFDPAESPEVDWTADEIQPQTCATCHDPHDIGTTSSEPNNTKVRVQGDTPMLMSGIMASDVGRGAICMVCHNSRRGLRNDEVFDSLSDPERAPHRGPQSDVLLGQNVYFLNLGDQGEADYPPGLPGGHATLADTCATCHMEATPPPADLANNGGGTNHLFNSNQQICGVCHIFDNGESLAESLAINMETLETLIEESWYKVIEQVTAPPAKGEKRAERFVDLNGEAIISYLNIGEIDKIIFTETSGRQALTFIFLDGTEIGPVRLGDIQVIEGVTVCQKGKTKQIKKAKSIDKTLAKGATIGSCEDGEQAVVLGGIKDFASPNLLKAGWNLLVIEADGSHGAHNPSFAGASIGSAISALADDAAKVQIQP